MRAPAAPSPHPGRPTKRGLSSLIPIGVALVAMVAPACVKKREESKPNASAAKPVADAKQLPPDWLKTERDVPPTPDLTKLIARFDANPDDKSRQWTLAAMGQLGEPAAAIWLAHLAASDNRLNRWAEDALASIKNRHSGLELGDVATSNAPPRVRAAAIRALAASGDLPQAAQLSALVANPEQPLMVREACALTLGAMRRPGGVPALETALTGAVSDTKMTGQQFRVTLIQALGRIGTEDAQQVLRMHAKRNLSETERRILEGALEPAHAPATAATGAQGKTAP